MSPLFWLGLALGGGGLAIMAALGLVALLDRRAERAQLRADEWPDDEYPAQDGDRS